MVTTTDGLSPNKEEENQPLLLDASHEESPGSIQTLLTQLQRYHHELDAKTREIQTSYERYFNLYNACPIGFLTLGCDEGDILAGNAAAWHKLRFNEEELLGKKLKDFIHPLDAGKLDNFLKSLKNQTVNSKLRIRLKVEATKPSHENCKGIEHCGCSLENCYFNINHRHLELSGAMTELHDNQNRIIVAVADITEFQIKQEILECSNHKLEQKIQLQIQELQQSHLDLSQQSLELINLKNKLAKLSQPVQADSASNSIESNKTPDLLITLSQLNAIFNAALEGIITMDPYGSIVSINQTVEKIFGYDQNELVSCHIDTLIPKSEQSQFPYRRITDSYLNLFSTTGETRECYGLHKNRSKIPLEISVAQFNLDGTTYLAAIIRNISSRKLRELRDKERLDELAHVTRLGLMGELASGIAHEVNQPLTAVTSYVQACINLINRDSFDRKQLIEVMQKTSDQALKAGQIIHRLRDLIKGKKIHQSMSDLNNLAYNAIEICASHIKELDINLQLQFCERIPLVFADPIQIEQVILNLLKNSIDSLTNVNYKKVIKIQTGLLEDNVVEFRICDNGPGVNEQSSDKLFNHFYTTKSSGMGMGLSICRSIIEAHEGEINFKTNPEKGITFYFSLPIRKRRP